MATILYYCGFCATTLRQVRKLPKKCNLTFALDVALRYVRELAIRYGSPGMVLRRCTKDEVELMENTEKRQDIRLPTSQTLHRLAVSDSGFVFDPASGHSFSVNETGFEILRFLQNDNDIFALMRFLSNRYHVDARSLERDLIEFIGLLRRATESADQ